MKSLLDFWHKAHLFTLQTHNLIQCKSNYHNPVSATSVSIFNTWTVCLCDSWCLGRWTHHSLFWLVSVHFACSLCVCVPPTVQTHACETNFKLWIGCKKKKRVGAMWRVHGVPCLPPSVIEDRPQPQLNKASAKKKNGRNEQLDSMTTSLKRLLNWETPVLY